MMQQQRNQRDNVVRGAFLALVFLASASFALASQTNGTINGAYKYAWSNVGGYVNFAPTNAGLAITDSAVTGYAWSANTGWLNFNPAQSHVTNDGAGNLGGYAWDSGGGWVSFTGVTIDSAGKFHGTATGGTVNGASYTLTFDCANCDVRTDWRPASSRTTTTSSGSGAGGSGAGGGCSSGFVWNPAAMRCVFASRDSYSPIIITDVSITPTASASPPALPASPASTTSGADGGNNSTVQTPVSPPASLKKTTAPSTARIATTAALAKNISWWQRIIASILSFLRFFMRF